MIYRTIAAILFLVSFISFAVSASLAQDTVIIPDRVFDGKDMHDGWAVRVAGNSILAAGPADSIDRSGAGVIRLEGATLLPGLIDLHSHILLHPYDETSWNDQVLKESHAERTLRAGNHLRATLMAGFTTLRDLGSEGAGYVDVGIRDALGKGVIEGPRLLVSGRALVASGSYGPKGFAEHVDVPLGAEEADGGNLVPVVRDQIGHGIDWVKVYADYRWGPHGEARPTYTQEELEAIVAVAASSGRPVVAHAATPEGMRRATLAGVETIEHGSNGTAEVFALMAERGVAWCPTLMAGESVSRYAGWDGGEPAPARVTAQRAAFSAALEAGVTICMGSDVGVFDHGDNWREIALMVDYGMSPLAALRAATSVNAGILGADQYFGRIGEGALADMMAVNGNPLQDISTLANVVFVMKDGARVR